MTTERKPLPRARARRAWKVALMDLCCLGLLAAWLLFALGTLYPRYLARTGPGGGPALPGHRRGAVRRRPHPGDDSRGPYSRL